MQLSQLPLEINQCDPDVEEIKKTHGGGEVRGGQDKYEAWVKNTAELNTGYYFRTETSLKRFFLNCCLSQPRV